MNPKNPGILRDKDSRVVFATVEDVMEKKLEDIATILFATVGGKSKLYEDVLTIVERSLFKIALRRSNNIKSAAATYLGINRNTFQNKMVKLGINGDNPRQRK